MWRLRWSCAALLSTLVIGVLPGVIGDGTCSLEGFDLEPLTKSYWVVSASGQQCPSTTGDCIYLFSLCFSGQDLGLCPNATACVRETTNHTVLSLGNYSSINAVDDTSFHVNYDQGSENVTIQFECDPQKTLGRNQGSAEEILVAKLEAKAVISDTSKHKNVAVLYAGACKKVKPVPKPSGMGPGGQLFIILIVIGVLYFGGGSFYNHVNGARGIELLPHHWFWTNLTGYVIDGCFFLVRLVTCQGRPTYNQSPDYGATSPAGVSPSGRTYESL